MRGHLNTDVRARGPNSQPLDPEFDALDRSATDPRSKITDRWYKKVIELANKVDVIESKPRTCGRQFHRGNAPATSISEYYKRNITISLIDHLNTELKNRFGAATTAAYSGLSIIPATLISSLNHSPNFDWKNHFMSCQFL